MNFEGLFGESETMKISWYTEDIWCMDPSSKTLGLARNMEKKITLHHNCKVVATIAKGHEVLLHEREEDVEMGRPDSSPFKTWILVHQWNGQFNVFLSIVPRGCEELTVFARYWSQNSLNTSFSWFYSIFGPPSFVKEILASFNIEFNLGNFYTHNPTIPID